MLEINNLKITKINDQRTLIDNFNLVLNKDDKIAIIGEEGNGKSTLIKAIYNRKEVEKYCHITGSIKFQGRIGYLEQILDQKWNDTLLNDYFLMENYDSEVDYSKYNELNKIANYLVQVKLDPKILNTNQIISTLSGGEKVKLQLAKIISSSPDILILDEPTNDLDIETLEWLEQFIINSKLPILFISHDETLLERCANGIIHIEQIKRKTECRFTIERIKYREYIEKRCLLLDKQESVARKQRSNYKKQQEVFNSIYQKVEHKQNSITRADPHGGYLLKKKMKSLKSQEKRYNREVEDFEEMPEVEEQINISFSDIIKVPNGKVIIDLDIPKLTIGNKILASNIKFKITGSTKNVILGKNGIGKTSLLKEVYKQLNLRKDIILGYMPQDYDLYLPHNKTPIDYLNTSTSKESITVARTYLGSMKFNEEEMLTTIDNLSGGQKAKLFLIKLVLDRCNVLLLDEPTRNLSPLSNPIIREILKTFQGTIISISHDRKYIEEVCDNIYELTKDGILLK